MTSLVHRLNSFWRFSDPAPTVRRRIAALAETEAIMRTALTEAGVRPHETHLLGGDSGWSAALPAGAEIAVILSEAPRRGRLLLAGYNERRVPAARLRITVAFAIGPAAEGLLGPFGPGPEEAERLGRTAPSSTAPFTTVLSAALYEGYVAPEFHADLVPEDFQPVDAGGAKAWLHRSDRLGDPAPGAVREGAQGVARTALCVAADIKGWSTRAVPDQIHAQHALMEVTRAALRLARLPERIEQTAGDSVLVIAPSGIDESTVIPDLLYGMRVALRTNNRVLVPSARLRLRLALTRGPVVPGPAGFGGDAVISCFRLLDAPPVKRALVDAPEADLAVIISTDLYRDVIRHGFRGLRPEGFRRVRCELPGKGFAEDAWLHVPGQVAESAPGAPV
ncbi:hypothetical protein [Spirillospora sp. NPDC029432]|uniref:hypothetical protein n=1 Tax=Spirillospora sp. NPDC029432 TaxID=3154599 RepID=UPI0034567A4B